MFLIFLFLSLMRRAQRIVLAEFITDLTPVRQIEDRQTCQPVPHFYMGCMGYLIRGEYEANK